MLRGQEVRWFSIFSPTVSLIILTGAFIYLAGFVEILELGGVTAYHRTVTHDEELLPAPEVY